MYMTPAGVKAQLRSGLQPAVRQTGQSNLVSATYKPGLNVRRVGAFSGLVKQYSMQHSMEMSVASGGGMYAASNVYTNSNIFQFSNALSARVDVGVGMTPFSNVPGMANGMNQPNLFIRNASIDYRPNERVSFHVSFSQDPYFNNVFRQPGARFNNGTGGF
jgi:hypothetical protein